MLRHHRRSIASLAIAVWGGGLVPSAEAELVRLEWRPTQLTVHQGGIVEVGLYLVSEGPGNQPVGSVSVILSWAPSNLTLIDRLDDGEVTWFFSGFPDDSGLDGINNTWDDGHAFYAAWMLFPPMPVATPGGIHITTFRFRALQWAQTPIVITPAFGENTVTRVVHGEAAGVDVTGSIGAAADVLILPCAPPNVGFLGSRYFTIATTFHLAPFAIHVTGDSNDPDIACLDLYFQADGTLGPDPVYLSNPDWGTFTEWGRFETSSAEFLPGKTYSLRADCDAGAPGSTRSLPGMFVTWPWGDTNGDRDADLADLLAMLDTLAGGTPLGSTFRNYDLTPCAPNALIDLGDLLVVLDALSGVDTSCPGSCP